MLNKDAIKQLESTLKLEEGTLSKAISSEEEVGIELPDLVVRTKEENETREKELKDNLKIAGAEIAVKTYAKENGIEIEDKSIGSLIKAVEANTTEKIKTELGKEPNERISELEGDLNSLRTKYEAKENEITELNNNIQNIKNQTQIDSLINGSIPDASKLSMDREHVSIIFNSKHTVELVDGKEVVKNSKGEVLKSDTEKPLTVSEVMNGEFITPFLKSPEGGSGGSDDPGNHKQGTYEAFEKEMIDKGVNVGSEEFNNEMANRIRQKTLEA
jgi:hypothetical protein